jgi:hypothetical protein
MQEWVYFYESSINKGDTMTATVKRSVLAFVAVAFAIAAVLVTSVQTSAHEGGHQENEKVTICHRTNSVKNPYVKITVDEHAVDGVAGNSGSKPDHYGEHNGGVPSSEEEASEWKKDKIKWGDIIPPVEGFHDGKNWTSEGQAFYRNNCNYPNQPEQPENPENPEQPEQPEQPGGQVLGDKDVPKNLPSTGSNTTSVFAIASGVAAVVALLSIAVKQVFIKLS